MQKSLPSKTTAQDLDDICFIQWYHITPWKSKIISNFCFQEPNNLKKCWLYSSDYFVYLKNQGKPFQRNTQLAHLDFGSLLSCF